MALDHGWHRQAGKKSSQEEDKKEEKNFLPDTFSSLKKRSEFLLIRKKGRSIHSKFFIINYSYTDKDDLRVGFTVSKKIGNAVTRNYLKRIFRSIIRNNWKSIKESISFEIIPKKKILNHSFTEIEKDIKQILNK